MEEEEKAKPSFDVERRVSFRIHEMPSSVVEDFLKFTREECGNKGWVAVKTLLEYRKIFGFLIDHDLRICELEGKGVMDKAIEEGQKEEDKPKDFKPLGSGGKKDGSV